MFTQNKSLNIHGTYSNMLNMLNMPKHAETCCRPLTPLFKKWGQGAAACFSPVLRRSEHVSACSVIFKVLNIEHVQFFFFHVQKTISCLLMFSMFSMFSMFQACSEHAEHEIDCKNGIFFPHHVPFRHFMFQHVQHVQHVSACSHRVLIMFCLCSHKIKA